jgi:AcrR family transcriptional regulator
MEKSTLSAETSVLDAPLQLYPYPIKADRPGSGSRQHIYQQRAMFRATARALLAERGYAGVHIRDLASRCGVTTQTLYNNIGGREEILSTAVDELLQVQIARAHAESERTGKNFMLIFCDLAARLLQPDWDYVSAVVSVLKEQDSRPSLADTVENRCIAAYRDHLLTMRKAGSLKHWVDVDVMATTLQDIIRSVLSVCWRNNATSDQLRDQLTMGVGLPLLGMSCGPEAARIEAVIESFNRR